MIEYIRDISRYEILPVDTFNDYLHFYYISRNEPSPATKICRDEIIKSNLRLVIKTAKAYKWSNIPIQDLVAVGNFGLFRALDKFEPSFNTSFQSYATLWIKLYIIRELKSNNEIPEYAQELLKKWRKVKTDLSLKLNRPPSAEEVNEILKFTEKAIRIIDKCEKRNKICSIDSKLDFAFADNIVDRRSLTPLNTLQKEEEKREFERVLSKFPQRSVDIVKAKGDGRLLKDIAKDHGISIERTNQVLARYGQKNAEIL